MSGPITASRQVPLTSSLGIFGWSHLDPLLLAALAMEAPVLLVGEHGTGKTLLVERVARSLRLAFRHYNASLVNYDDLVGIPLPDDEGDLRFVGTQSAVWDAQFVFFDEVNRCRPDLQNKMFPIVHERRVAGQDLPGLKHRWAAMNPPGDSETFAPSGYLGAEQLDAALADRFTFVIEVPTWKALDRVTRERLAAGDSDLHDCDFDMTSLVLKARNELDRRTDDALLVSWAVTLADLLADAGIPLSPRRVRTLVRAAVGTTAAAAVLGHPLTAESAAELTLLNALPATALDGTVSVSSVVGAHKQAWSVSDSQTDPVMRLVFEQRDPVQRIHVAAKHGLDDARSGVLVTSALAAQATRARQTALAVVLSRALATHDLTPAAWGSIAELAAPVLTPAAHRSQISPGRDLEAWRAASALMASDARITELETALLAGCGPELLAQEDVEELLTNYRAWLNLFEVTS